MQEVTSSLSQVFCFPLDGRIVTIDQKYFDNFSTKASSGAMILVIDHSQSTTENVGVGMYPSLMELLIVLLQFL